MNARQTLAKLMQGNACPLCGKSVLRHSPNVGFANGKGDQFVAVEYCTCEPPKSETKNPPYPWCSQPDVCALKGYCKADPNCGG